MTVHEPNYHCWSRPPLLLPSDDYTLATLATCLQVPVLVQSTLADAADDLVRLVNRQWAVHTRMTVGAAGAASGTGAVTRTDSSSSIKTSASGGTEGRQRARVQPVKLEAAAPPAGSGTAAEARAAAAQEAAMQEDGSDIDRTTQQSSSARRVVAAPIDGKAAKGHAVFDGAVGSCSKTFKAAAQPAANGTVPPVVKVAEAAGSSLSRATADGSSEGLDPAEGTPADATAAPLPTAVAAAADPSSPAGILAGFLATHAPIQSYKQGVPEPSALVPCFRAAAEAAAQQLVDGVTDRQFSMGEVEQLLIQALQQAQAATQAAQVPVTGGNSACATGGPPSIQQVFAHRQQEHLLLLLAGALMHALMCCPTVKAAVWAGGLEAGTAEAEAAAAVSLPHLTQLPVLLMKAARGDMPVWLLRQLRQWMQQATLGCH